MTLFDRLKQHVRGRVEPVELLRKPLERGLPYYLGTWFYDEFFSEDRMEDLKDEYRAWFLSDFADFLVAHECDAQCETVLATSRLLQRIDVLYERDESKYFRYLESDRGACELSECYITMLHANAGLVAAMRTMYAVKYSDRMMHDRQLCAYIAELVVRIGFDGDDNDIGEPSRWVARERWPERVKSILRARERGKCSICHVDMTQELDADTHIDHIIPLAQGGCNDIVNLQLLCSSCNLAKTSGTVPVRSSIPEYIGRRRCLRRDAD
ncbi:MAG: HNH endonuclease [Phycisphaera sp.]|nr:MAG: HNH endonuclease [Phycisphaera sp.]